MPRVATAAPQATSSSSATWSRHARFGRDGDNLTVRVPVSFDQAALGGEIEVPILDGSPVTLRIKAGTQPGSLHRRQGRGHRQAPRRPDRHRRRAGAHPPHRRAAFGCRGLRCGHSPRPVRPPREKGSDRHAFTQPRCLRHLGRGRTRRHAPADVAHLRAPRAGAAAAHPGREPPLQRRRHRAAPPHPGPGRRGHEPRGHPPGDGARGRGRAAAGRERRVAPSRGRRRGRRLAPVAALATWCRCARPSRSSAAPASATPAADPVRSGRDPLDLREDSRPEPCRSVVSRRRGSRATLRGSHALGSTDDRAARRRDRRGAVRNTSRERAEPLVTGVERDALALFVRDPAEHLPADDVDTAGAVPLRGDGAGEHRVGRGREVHVAGGEALDRRRGRLEGHAVERASAWWRSAQSAKPSSTRRNSNSNGPSRYEPDTSGSGACRASPRPASRYQCPSGLASVGRPWARSTRWFSIAAAPAHPGLCTPPACSVTS